VLDCDRRDSPRRKRDPKSICSGVFRGILNKISDSGGWYDVNSKEKVSDEVGKQSNTAVWIPNNRVGETLG